MDDLKALRDEIAGAGTATTWGATRNREWAARLTSFIERYEKERAEGIAAIEHIQSCQDCSDCFEECNGRALTERAKPK
jgi:hypothetical protein